MAMVLARAMGKGREGNHLHSMELSAWTKLVSVRLIAMELTVWLSLL
jgi:hypothetical protein